jgi:hypothetical protein
MTRGRTVDVPTALFDRSYFASQGCGVNDASGNTGTLVQVEVPKGDEHLDVLL